MTTPRRIRRPRRVAPTLIQQSRSASPEAKAVFNQEGRRPREFFALSSADEDAIYTLVAARLDQLFDIDE